MSELSPENLALYRRVMGYGHGAGGVDSATLNRLLDAAREGAREEGYAAGHEAGYEAGYEAADEASRCVPI